MALILGSLEGLLGTLLRNSKSTLKASRRALSSSGSISADIFLDSDYSTCLDLYLLMEFRRSFMYCPRYILCLDQQCRTDSLEQRSTSDEFIENTINFKQTCMYLNHAYIIRTCYFEILIT